DGNEEHVDGRIAGNDDGRRTRSRRPLGDPEIGVRLHGDAGRLPRRGTAEETSLVQSHRPPLPNRKDLRRIVRELQGHGKCRLATPIHGDEEMTKTKTKMKSKNKWKHKIKGNPFWAFFVHEYAPDNGEDPYSSTGLLNAIWNYMSCEIEDGNTDSL